MIEGTSPERGIGIGIGIGGLHQADERKRYWDGAVYKYALNIKYYSSHHRSTLSVPHITASDQMRYSLPRWRIILWSTQRPYIGPTPSILSQ